MKVIDLLNKIANGEETPKKIHFKYSVYQFDEIDKVYRNINGNQQLEQDYMISNKLNEEIEVIEDKKIEKLYVKERANDFLIGKSEHVCYGTESYVNKIIADKINEIIDYLEENKKC